MSRLFATAVTVAAFATALAAAAPAAAEVLPGNNPAETIQTAYPTQSGVTYHGAFQPDTASGYHDLDYLAFKVASAGETVQFTLQNTTTGVNPNDFEFCPVYLSILDGSNTLVANGAGTIATYNDTETFDWTFSAAGTYYMVMESNGDMPAGDPTYAVSYRAPAPASSAPLVRLLRVAQHQRGSAVAATIKLGRPALSIRALLLSAQGKTIAVVKQTSLNVGTHRLTLRLPTSVRRVLEKLHRLSLTVKISVRGTSAKATYRRRVTLTG